MERPSSQDLTVREHARITCDLAGSVSIGDGGPVRLSARAPASGGAFAVRVTDVSRGGMSLRSAIYLPRTAEVSVLIAVPGSDERVKVALRIKSVSMVDRGPSYAIGGQFVDTSIDGQASVDRLLSALRPEVGERRERPGA